MILSLIISIILGLLFGAGVAFLVCSISLSKSNNYGDTTVNDQPLISQLTITNRANNMVRTNMSFENYLTQSMQETVNSDHHKYLMGRSIKGRDDELVTHERAVR